MPHGVLSKLSYFDVRRVLRDERDVERYLGIQRPLDPKRVSELESYVNYRDASFPTSIIVAAEEDYARFDESTNTMTVTNMREGENKPSIAFGKIAPVLDGQHRIAGCTNLKEMTTGLT
jgi:DGQHR domain-containing protein